jgi:hypothetical protein
MSERLVETGDALVGEGAADVVHVDAGGGQPAQHLGGLVDAGVEGPGQAAVVFEGGDGLLGERVHGVRTDEHLRVARVVYALEATPDLVREAASDVLADPTYRLNAERMRDEIAALPGPDHAVTLLERLATEREPLLSG